MVRKRLGIGIVLMIISLLLLVISFKVLLGFSIVLFIIGLMSILNPNENRIERINYSKMNDRVKRERKNGK